MQHDRLLMSLPVPTPEQTARFADHVADNHSWYKHLPFFPPGASFVLFPNAHAGRAVTAVGDRYVISDVEQGDYFTHHSQLPTAEYLARFGHWDYWVDDNPWVSDLRPGPWLYSADGRRELLADNAKQRWSCRLTAFLKPAPPMFKQKDIELRREADAFMAAGPGPFGRWLRGVFGGRPGEDSAVRRYRAVAPALRRAAGTFGDASLYAFMEEEALAQRAVLLGALHRVRAEWAGGLPPRF